MPGIHAEDLLDHVKMTNHDFGKYRWTDISFDLQEHVAMPMLMRKEKVKFKSGDQIQFNVRTGTSGQARHKGLYAVDSFSKTDHMQHALIPWKHTESSWTLDEIQLSMNMEPARIIDEVEEARTDMLIDAAKLFETAFWGKPLDSDDSDVPYGIKYWLPKHVTGTSASGSDGIPGGFNGSTATGFSDVSGLSPTTFTNWRNWTFKYVSVTQKDLIRSWRKAATFTHFMNPVQVPTYNRGDRWGYYVPYSVYGPLEESLESQNSNLGNDIASKDGKPLFRGVPVTWTPQLDSDSDAPVYGINWGLFYPVFLNGWYAKEKGPEYAPNQHTVIVTWVDWTWNLCAKDRRAHFVGATANSD